MCQKANLRVVLLLFFFLISFNSLIAQNYVQRFDSLFNSLNQDGEFSAAILIRDSNKLVYEKYFGFEDIDKKIAIDSNSRFELASVSKQFTAFAIMQLQNQGKLSYQDKLDKYFPELPFKNVTIEQLLRHTSGIPEFLGFEESWFNKTKSNSNKDIIKIIKEHIDSTKFVPGTQCAYSNTNYILLAELVERVSKMPFEKYMQQNIFHPARMENSSVFSFLAQKKKVEHYAIGQDYDYKTQKFQNVRNLPSYSFVNFLDGITGPYGISSTPRDLMKWDDALNQSKLLPDTSFQKAISVGEFNDGTNVRNPWGMFSGYGWLFMEEENKPKMHFHTGGWPGYQTIIVRNPEKKKLVVILINKYRTVDVFPLMTAIDAILQNREVIVVERNKNERIISLIEFQINELIGTYESVDDKNIKYLISANDDGQLFAKYSDQESVEVFPISPLEVIYNEIEARILFKKDKEMVSQLTLFQNGKEMVFKKVN